MVNWKQGLFRSWIVATGYWVITIVLVAFYQEVSLFHHDGSLDVEDLIGIFAAMAAGPILLVLSAILLLLVGRSVVWARRGFVKE